jgi:hypothetical protein
VEGVSESTRRKARRAIVSNATFWLSGGAFCLAFFADLPLVMFVVGTAVALPSRTVALLASRGVKRELGRSAPHERRWLLPSLRRDVFAAGWPLFGILALFIAIGLLDAVLFWVAWRFGPVDTSRIGGT